MATIRNARVAASVSQRDLSARIGRTHNFINKAELGERSLSFLEVIDIAEAIGIDPADLLDQILSHDKPAAKPYPIVVSAKKSPKRRERGG